MELLDGLLSLLGGARLLWECGWKAAPKAAALWLEATSAVAAANSMSSGLSSTTYLAGA